MGERIKGVTVTFNEDMHEEDATVIIAAFRAFRCVASVVPATVDFEDVMNRERAKQEIRQEIWKVVK